MSVRGDGDGWVTCGYGHRHWGRFGAAGLLLRHHPGGRAGPPTGAAQAWVLLQHRAPWSHHGDTWGLPGGARDSHEDPVPAALREAGEEATIDLSGIQVTGAHYDDHGGWSYTTVLASSGSLLAVRPANAESVALRWVVEAEVSSLPLHPGFAASWPLLATAAGGGMQRPG